MYFVSSLTEMSIFCLLNLAQLKPRSQGSLLPVQTGRRENLGTRLVQLQLRAASESIQPV